MKIEVEQVSNGWLITIPGGRKWVPGNGFDVGWWGEGPPTCVVARNVPDCLAELGKIMEGK